MAEDRHQSKKTSIGNIGNSVYNSPYRRVAWDWIKNGLPLSEVKSALEEQGFSCTLPVLYNFRDIMQDFENRGIDINAGGFVDSNDLDDDVRRPEPLPSIENVPDADRVRNDGEVLDLIILQFSKQLKAGEAEIDSRIALKAIEMKKSMMGAKYKGQTVWSLMESQLQIDKLLEVMNRHVTAEQFDAIVAEMESSGIVSTQRPAGLGSTANLDLDNLLDDDPLKHVTDI